MLFSVIGIAVVAVVGWALRARQPEAVPLPPMKTPASNQATPAAEAATAAIVPPKAPAKAPAVQAGTPAAHPATPDNFVARAADYLLDPQAAYVQRQEFLNRLRQEGQLKGVVAELEKRAAEDPNNPAIPANLGQAYLLQASLATNSISEQGMLGLKADQTFDHALDLDPNSWEARFWKATAMAHWPAVLNKQREVMEHYVKLVEQQETEPPQPQFADTYAWLGKEYVKAGYPDYARQAWERGLAFFPNHEQLTAQLKGLQK